MDEQDGITLTCKMGTFTFNNGVLMSKARRIRDEVVGQFFAPKEGLPRIKSVNDAEEFVRNQKHLRDVADIPFEVMIREEWRGRRRTEEPSL